MFVTPEITTYTLYKVYNLKYILFVYTVYEKDSLKFQLSAGYCIEFYSYMNASN